VPVTRCRFMEAPMTEPILRVRGLTKRYGERVALKSLDLQLQAGQFTALLGPNGAGKSTLFQVLTGLFVADEGEVEVAGHSLRSAAPSALRHIGVVFQQMALDLDLSVKRNLLFQAARDNPRVLKEPEPQVFFLNFGESRLEHELRLHVRDLGDRNPVIDEINRHLDQEFRARGIVIAFRQLDVHLKNPPSALDIQLAVDDGSAEAPAPANGQP